MLGILSAAAIPVVLSEDDDDYIEEKDKRLMYADALRYVKSKAEKIKVDAANRAAGKPVNFPPLNISRFGEKGVRVILKAPASAFASVQGAKESEEGQIKKFFEQAS
jgi:hypothetical protein